MVQFLRREMEIRQLAYRSANTDDLEVDPTRRALPARGSLPDVDETTDGSARIVAPVSVPAEFVPAP